MVFDQILVELGIYCTGSEKGIEKTQMSLVGVIKTYKPKKSSTINNFIWK